MSDETTICEAFLPDGGQCGREFPDLLAWQEHFEDTHAEEDDGDTIARHMAVCRELGCEYDLPAVPCDGCASRYATNEDDGPADPRQSTTTRRP